MIVYIRFYLRMTVASDDDVQYMYRKIEEELTRWVLNINMNKTEYLNVGGKVKDLRLPRGTASTYINTIYKTS